MFKLSGKRPANLGSKNGKLAPVVKKPNNVSSQTDVSDRAHYVAPLKFTGDAAVAFQKLLKMVQSQPRASVVTQDGQYLHVVAPSVAAEKRRSLARTRQAGPSRSDADPREREPRRFPLSRRSVRAADRLESESA